MYIVFIAFLFCFSFFRPLLNIIMFSFPSENFLFSFPLKIDDNVKLTISMINYKQYNLNINSIVLEKYSYQIKDRIVQNELVSMKHSTIKHTHIYIYNNYLHLVFNNKTIIVFECRRGRKRISKTNQHF